VGVSAPASAKPARFEQSPMAASPHDDRFPWLDRGYVSQVQVAPRRERASRERAGRVSSRTERRLRAEARMTGTPAASFGGGGGLVSEARRYLGTNPTGRASLWCGRFMNMVLERSGRHGTGSDMARSFASYGSRVSGPQVGAIAVMSRGKGGGHVGIVSGIDADGNPIIISGNHGNRVAEATYQRGRVYAYVMP
jgi:uncharacterized protein (TIGR02594 family)